jgi:hypothetical protein
VSPAVDSVLGNTLHLRSIFGLLQPTDREIFVLQFRENSVSVTDVTAEKEYNQSSLVFSFI